MRLAWATLVLASLFIGCGPGGGGGGGGGQGDCTPGPTASIAVTASGFTPKAVCITPSGTVIFANQDSVDHLLSLATCGQGSLTLSAGQSTPLVFPTAQTCTFFDLAHQGVDAFNGTVAVSSAPVVGPGY
jgi:hypothetical protein